MSKSKYPSDTFCILPWIHLSTRPDGSMRVCCTANASAVGPTNDKKYGGAWSIHDPIHIDFISSAYIRNPSVKKFLEITEKSLKWKPRIKKKLIMIFLNLPKIWNFF